MAGTDLRVEEFRAYVEPRFAEEFSALYPHKIQFPNIKFAPPKNAPYVAFNNLMGDMIPVTLGSVKFDRHIGILQVDVLVPEETGGRDAGLIAEHCAGLFGNLTFRISDVQVVRFKPSTVRTMGAQNGWFRVMVRTPYWRDVKQS